MGEKDWKVVRTDEHPVLDEKDIEIMRLREQKQIAVNALFEVCQNDWGVGHSIARPAHRAMKELAALEPSND